MDLLEVSIVRIGPELWDQQLIQCKELESEVMLIEVPQDLAFGGVVHLADCIEIQCKVLKLDLQGGNLHDPDKFWTK